MLNENQYLKLFACCIPVKGQSRSIICDLQRYNFDFIPNDLFDLLDKQASLLPLGKLKDEFVWHSHQNEDELFMVFKGTLLMDFRDGRTVEVKEGEILIVPRGVEHCPRTNGEIVFNLLFEPKAIEHTGNVESDMTVKELDWI